MYVRLLKHTTLWVAHYIPLRFSPTMAVKRKWIPEYKYTIQLNILKHLYLIILQKELPICTISLTNLYSERKSRVLNPSRRNIKKHKQYFWIHVTYGSITLYFCWRILAFRIPFLLASDSWEKYLSSKYLS